MQQQLYFTITELTPYDTNTNFAVTLELNKNQ